MRRLVATFAMFTVGAPLMAGLVGDAEARGFCNIDETAVVDQGAIASAGAEFYGAGVQLLTMLQALERRDTELAEEAGRLAQEQFQNAATLYGDVTVPEEVDDRLRGVNRVHAADIAHTRPEDALFEQVFSVAQESGAQLIAMCAKAAENMAEATGKFVQRDQDVERTYAELLRQWSTALYTGRVASGIFATAAGEE
jgi:hypothetical protein